MSALPKRLLAIGALAACLLGWAAPAIAQKPGGVLRVTHRDNPPSASIHEEATISTVMPFMACLQQSRGVRSRQPSRTGATGSSRISPPSGRWSDDGSTLTFKLRDGVKWHDGKPFTSADVKCTWDMLIGKVEAKLRKNPRKSW